MSERIINTDKLDVKYGIKNYNSIDRIDVFIDIENSKKYLVIENRTEYEKGKPMSSQRIFRFNDQNAFDEYIRKNISNYELTHIVPEEQSELHYHYVTFKNITYYLHNGHPDMNYLEFNYIEYKDNQPSNGKIRLDGTYEYALIEALKESKKISGNLRNNSKYYRLIDVKKAKKEQRVADVRQNVEKISFSINEFCDIVKIGWNKHKREIIKGFKIVCSSILIYMILSHGYVLVESLLKKREKVVDMKLPTYNKEDTFVRKSTDKATDVIRKIMFSDIEEINKEDIDFIVEYLKTIEMINHDKNSSYAVFNYDSYFLPALSLINEDDTITKYNCQQLLKKISEKYDDCFQYSGTGVVINKDKSYDFFRFVSSLTYAPDVEVRDLMVGLNKYAKKTSGPGFATVNEIRAYKSLPTVVKLVILTQLKGIERDMKFTFKDIPKYYSGGNNFESINNLLNTEYNKTVTSMYNQLNYRHHGKSM